MIGDIRRLAAIVTGKRVAYSFTYIVFYAPSPLIACCFLPDYVATSYLCMKQSFNGEFAIPCGVASELIQVLF